MVPILAIKKAEEGVTSLEEALSVTLGAEYQQNRAALVKMGLVIATDRPFGDMADQCAATHIEGSDLDAKTFCLGGID